MSRKTLQEHIDRIRYISKYPLKEASYKAILSDELNSVDNDVLSKSIYSGVQPQTPNNTNIFDSIVSEDSESNIENTPTGTTETPLDTTDTINTGDSLTVDTQSVSSESLIPSDSTDIDKKQTDLLALQLDIIKKLNEKVKELDSLFKNLDYKYQQLNKEVEEVREPTNQEKLMSRKQDSHPFYYNLNDLWKGNWFEARRDQYNEKGIIKLDDGTYIADFDNLPKLSDKEIRDSFLYYEGTEKKSNSITESTSHIE